MKTKTKKTSTTSTKKRVAKKKAAKSTAQKTETTSETESYLNVESCSKQPKTFLEKLKEWFLG